MSVEPNYVDAQRLAVDLEKFTAGRIAAGQFSTDEVLTVLFQRRLSLMSDVQFNLVLKHVGFAFPDIERSVMGKTYSSKSSRAFSLTEMLSVIKNGISQLAIVFLHSEGDLEQLARS